VSFGSARLTDGLAKAIPSYAAFVAAITAKAVNGSRPAGSPAYAGSGTQKFQHTLTADGGTMAGSPWMSRFGISGGNPGVVQRFVRHCFPNQAAFEAYLAAGRMVYFQVQPGADSAEFDPPGINRNGYSSLNFASEDGTAVCTDFIYYDNVAGPQRMNPLAGAGPTPYTLGT
jgi:hypothetical protein